MESTIDFEKKEGISMTIRKAIRQDLPFLLSHDRHIAADEIRSVVSLGRMLVLEEKEHIIGWLRWNLFWDNTPFMNMLYVLEGERGNGPRQAARFPLGSVDES